MKKILITAVAVAFVISSGTFAYTYTTAGQIIGVAEPTGDIAISDAMPTQPDWDTILDDLSSENITHGNIPTGDLFTITPEPTYSGDLMVNLYLNNTGNLTKAYRYLNMDIYMLGSDEAEETPNYRMLTMQNGQTTLTLQDLVGSIDTWTETSQADFADSTLNQVDTTTSPGDVLLDTYSDNVTDTYDDETKIASSANVTVSGGQVKLTIGDSGDETLRPNATGNVTDISSQYPVSGAHWDKVDEVTADNYTTYVSTNSTSYERDLYGIPAHSIGSGGINSVTVYFRFAGDKAVYAIPYGAAGDLGYLKTVEIVSGGNITDTVIDTLEYDAVTSKTPDILHISGNIFAIAYAGDDDDGTLKTVEITSDGSIADTVIDTLEFDTVRGKVPDIIHISGDVYAIAYQGGPLDSDLGYLKTVEITSSGDITDTVIDTMGYDVVKGKDPDIIHISGDVYAIAYAGDGDDGYLRTVEISSSGNITDTEIDYLEFDGVKGKTPDIIPISGDIYVIAYAGDGDDGTLKTVEITSSGNITDTVIDTLNFDAAQGKVPNIIPISGDVYAIAYLGGPGGPAGDLGYLKTVEITSSGNITDTVIDTLNFDAVKGKNPRIISISGDNNNYAIAYAGDGDDGFLKTVEIAANGQITDTVIDTLEFDTDAGKTPDIINVTFAGEVYARAVIRTHGTVYTGGEESTTGDTFVTKSYQWTTNPNTGEDWTWDEIDALQIGVDLKTYYDHDSAELTQVYVEVNYTAYKPSGTITSINLLSGEAVASTDNFSYDASAIPSGTSLKVQFSQDSISWYSSANVSGGWDTLSQGIDTIDLSGLGWSGSNFYYHMVFTSDAVDTPVLDEITVGFTSYYSSGSLTSSAYDTGTNVYWYNIYFAIDEPSATDIKFQIRTAATEGGLSSATWYGPSGTGDYYTTTGAAINTVHDSDRWIQYKAYFSGPGDDTPMLSDISITYATSSETYTIQVIGGSYGLVSDDTLEWAAGWTVTPELICEVIQR
ncbi:hypothetical protein ES703_43185 [subsurface metagenome]